MELPESTLVGYAWLAKNYNIITLPYWKESRVLSKGAKRLIEKEGRQIEFLPPSQKPLDHVFSHLEFALRNEGLHLELLKKLLPLLSSEEITTYIRSKPTGRYARVIWWLFEEFTKIRLNLPDALQGNYVDLLDPTIYVTGFVTKAKRQRINVNLLGTSHFSPMVRQKGLGEWDDGILKKRCEEIAGDYPPEVFQRAVRYLYAKESKSSYEIERESPDQKRAEKFISLLEQAWHRDFLSKSALVELQEAIVDHRYANHGWRSDINEQIYVGETLAPGRERVHFAAPKPEDLDELMDLFLNFSKKCLNIRVSIPSVSFIMSSPVPTLVAASVISFIFNFLHPFSDGNGRIHRFLLHYVLAHNGFGPDGIILPVSAVILNHPREYDQALESFSKPLMRLVEYTMDEQQQMMVQNNTADFYRYIDCTEITRITIGFIRETIENELPMELRFLTRHSEIRKKMRAVVELPDRIADLFIALCRQNGGTLSKKKRNLKEFSPLTDLEINGLEKIISEGLS